MAAPALRFAEPVPPPDLSVKPPGGAPPQPVEANPIPAATPVAPAEATPAAPADATPAAELETAKPAKATTPPPTILPDDTRTKVRPEDFLPFFQFPGSSTNPNDVTVVLPGVPTPPAPGTQPPSTATYRQQ